MERITFTKMTGSGNDFILIDNRRGTFDTDRCAQFVRKVCRRQLSVGADGVIFIEDDPECDFRWRFFNADGGEAEMCGNGSRCAARFAVLNGIAPKERLAFRTLAGIIRAEVSGIRVKVQMTEPFDHQPDVNVEAAGKDFSGDFINTGVPHFVVFLSDEASWLDFDVVRFGRALRYHERFQPAGTNVNFAVVAADGTLRVRTYERGVEDETLACGTGSIAAALTAFERGWVSPPVSVETRGGEILTIHFRKEGERFLDVFLEGDARVVYEGRLWEETL